MLKSFLPLDVGVGIKEMIVVMMPALLSKVISQLAITNRLSLLAKISACLVESNRIEGSEHSYIRKNRCIILSVAVTIR